MTVSEYTSQSEPNTVTDIEEAADEYIDEHRQDGQSQKDDYDMMLDFTAGAKWALQQTQAVGVSEDDLMKFILWYNDLSPYLQGFYKNPKDRVKRYLELLNQKK